MLPEADDAGYQAGITGSAGRLLDIALPELPHAGDWLSTSLAGVHTAEADIARVSSPSYEPWSWPLDMTGPCCSGHDAARLGAGTAVRVLAGRPEGSAVSSGPQQGDWAGSAMPLELQEDAAGADAESRGHSVGSNAGQLLGLRAAGSNSRTGQYSGSVPSSSRPL